MLTLYQLQQSPDLYPVRIDPRARAIEFCEMDRDSYGKSPFLDHRIVKAGAQVYSLRFEDLPAAADCPRPEDTRYIFHSAFCCSTLLSRYLDAVTGLPGLREPHSLYELATFRRFYGIEIIPNVTPPEWQQLFHFLGFLLARRYDPSRPVVVKPTDGCSNLVGDLIGASAGNRGIFIYSGLRRFLVSVLKYPDRHEWARIRLRELTLDRKRSGQELRHDPRLLNGWQTAALVWIYHMENYALLSRDSVGDRIFSLDCDTLLSKPVPVLCAILAHFGDQPDNDRITRALDNPELRTHSKDSRLSYDEDARQRDYQQGSLALENEIRSAVDWARDVMGSDPGDFCPPNPLSTQPD